MGKRTMDFKVSYLDAGLTNSYFADQDSSPNMPSAPSTPSSTTPKTRRYKTQLRDFLSSCRTKKKQTNNSVAQLAVATVPAATDYPSATSYHLAAHHSSDSALQIHQAAAAAAAAAVSYTTNPTYNCNVYNNYSHHHPSDYTQPNFYHHTNFENRYLDNALFQYRALGTYYPEYSNCTPTYNGFLDVSHRDRLYDTAAGVTSTTANCDYKPYMNSQHHPVEKKLFPTAVEKQDGDSKSAEYLSHYTNGHASSTPPSADSHIHPRQTVLMWGSSGNHGATTTTASGNSSTSSIGHHLHPSSSPRLNHSSSNGNSNGSSSHHHPNNNNNHQTAYENVASGKKYAALVDPLRSLSEMNSGVASSDHSGSKWGSIIKSGLAVMADSGSSSMDHGVGENSNVNGGSSNMTAAVAVAKNLYLPGYGATQPGTGIDHGGNSSATEVWAAYPPPHTHQ